MKLLNNIIMGNRTIPFDADATCDNCGHKGAFDFMGDYLCDACVPAAIPPENPPIDNKPVEVGKTIEDIIEGLEIEFDRHTNKGLISKPDFIMALKEYAQQKPPVEVQKEEGKEYTKGNLEDAYNAGVSEGSSQCSAFEWGTRRKDIEFKDWFEDEFPNTKD